MSRHTPGPWSYAQHHLGDFRITDEADRVVAETRPPGNCNSTGNEHANARLIAAAPDMLAAIKAIKNCAHLAWTDTANIKPAFDRIEQLAREAIARVEEPQ